MQKQIKLTPKQLESVSSTQKQKMEVLKVYNDLCQREQAVVDIILDINGVTDKPTEIKLEGDSLVLSFPEKAPKSKRPITDPD